MHLYYILKTSSLYISPAWYLRCSPLFCSLYIPYRPYFMLVLPFIMRANVLKGRQSADKETVLRQFNPRTNANEAVRVVNWWWTCRSIDGWPFLIEYEILATQASGEYQVEGSRRTMQQSTAEFYPQTITETVFDVLPRVRESVNGVNFLGRKTNTHRP